MVLLCTHYEPLQCLLTYFRKLQEIGVLRPIFRDYVISCDYVCMKKFSFNSNIWKHPPKCVFFGNLGIGISASASLLESLLALVLQKNYFFLQKYFWKNKMFMLFLVLSYGISTSLLQKHFSTISYSSIQRHPWCSRKRLFELSEPSVHWCFEKITTPKVSAYFPVKHPVWSPS